ncbi:MAG TPA: MBL fold metallo-hydrolase [Bryobacteraceae bacterium]|jgi:glyoxylase-like metal-dependent hydrolase (beta-lactamase superfamily II)|nr:MBL fold metallo-hydrolase [Bryobacteraceae bacterium]
MLRRAVCTATILAILGAAAPAFAQIDLSGEWAGTFHEDLPHRGGVRLGDYTGLPLNEAGWRKGQSWDEDARSTPERQCIPHVVTYALRGPATIRFNKVVDPASGELQAYLLQGSYGRPRTIWMDGREHPSDLAPHTWGGFSTGIWVRNTLAVSTTHIKTGWLLRNGAPTSDLATMQEYFTRYDDYLVAATIVNDPVYLEEPMIRTSNFVLSLTTEANAWGNCGPAQITDELGGRPKGAVPHYLPGETAHIQEFVTKSGVPAEAARGGAATIYPEYMAKLKSGNLDNRLFPEPLPGKNLPRVVSPQTSAPDDVVVLPVQENVYLLAGAGGNMAVQVGPDGVLLVDAGAGKVTDKVISAIRKLSTKPIRFILNTNADLDHMGGNERLAAAGSTGGGGRASDTPRPGALVIAQEAVLKAVSAPTGKQPAMPFGAWPTEGYPGDYKEVFFNGEAIQIFHQPAAHSDGDSLVFFRRSDVVATGDIFSTTSYPVIDVSRGGSINGVVAGLNHIIDITIPKDWQEGGTMVIPGHGRIADEADIVEYRDMVTIIRDRVQNLIRKGMTLDQVRAARPTLEYDPRYGSESGPWTTAMFVEAVYRGLSQKK